jgi:hypothetical protein
VLVAYFDESGTGDKHDAIAVGGFVGDAMRWETFSRQWRRVLDREGVSAFHATDLESGHGEFEGWDKKRSIKFRGQLLERLRGVVAYGVSAGLDKRHYREYVKGDDLRAKVGKDYTVCAVACVGITMEWAARSRLTEQIDFVFEDGPAVPKGELLAQIDQMRLKQPLIGPVTFGDKTTLPLQAADLHAYEGWKHFSNREVDGKIRDVRKSLEAMLRLGSDKIGGAWFEREGLRTVVEHKRQGREWTPFLTEAPPRPPVD